MTVADEDNVVLLPNIMALNAHLYALFPPAWVKDYPDAWIEIATADPASSRAVNTAMTFSAFDLKAASDHAVAMNRRGLNVYVGAALRKGEVGTSGRGSDANYLASRFAWVDADKDHDGLCVRLAEQALAPYLAIRTGSTPTPRVQLYFLLDGDLTGGSLRSVNAALQKLLGTDAVGNPSRLLRLNGSVSYPPPDKAARGYVPEVVGCDDVLHRPRGAPPLDVARLLGTAPQAEAPREATGDPWVDFAAGAGGRKGRDDDALLALLKASREAHCWHNSIRDAIATMVGRGWEETAIRLACAPYCRDGAGDRDLAPLIGGAFAKFGKASPEEEGGDPPPGEGGGQAPPKQPQADDDYELHWYDPTATVLRSWLVDKFLPESGVGLLSGQWGTSKSFIALDLAASVMTGLPFVEQGIARPGGVLYVAAEAASEMQARLKALIEHKLKPIATEAMLARIGGNLDDPPFVWLEDDPNLQSPKDVKKLVRAAKNAAAALEARFNLSLVLIVIDTLSVTGHYVDENDAAENQRVMSVLAALSRATGAFVLALDHFGKAVETGTRGSSVKEGSADAVIAVQGEKTVSGTVRDTRISLRKSRGARTGEEIRFERRVVTVDALSGETSCLIDWQARAPSASTAATPDKGKKKRWPDKLYPFRVAMHNAMAEHGKQVQPFGAAGPTVMAVPGVLVRAEFLKSYPADDSKDPAAAKRMAYSRLLKVANPKYIQSREIDMKDHFWFVEADDEA